ncbi:unnamed protein product [Urochloa humidicola]
MSPALLPSLGPPFCFSAPREALSRFPLGLPFLALAATTVASGAALGQVFAVDEHPAGKDRLGLRWKDQNSRHC